MASSHLHAQARTAHRKAGTYLADRAAVLEAEMDNSRRILAAALAPDRAERSSSAHAFVLSSIGLGERDGVRILAQGASGSERDETAEASGGCQNLTSTSGFREAMMRAEVSSRRVPKLYRQQKTTSFEFYIILWADHIEDHRWIFRVRFGVWAWHK